MFADASNIMDRKEGGGGEREGEVREGEK